MTKYSEQYILLMYNDVKNLIIKGHCISKALKKLGYHSSSFYKHLTPEQKNELNRLTHIHSFIIGSNKQCQTITKYLLTKRYG